MNDPRQFLNTSRGLSRRSWLKGTAGMVSAWWATGVGAGAQSNTAVPVRELEARYPELRFINLAGNENPHGPSPRVAQAIVRAMPESCRYPFREEEILRDDIAMVEGVDPECVVLGHGCDEILALAGTVFGHPEANIVSSRPTYLWLMRYAQGQGATIRWVDVDGLYHVDLEALGAAVDHATTCVYLCNPETPLGTVLDPERVRDFARSIAPRTALFLDEVYLDLLEDFPSRTLVDLVREGLPIIIGRSFSKMHALAGHRIGYAVTTPGIAASLKRHQMSSLNWIGVAAARASLRDERFHQRSRRLIREGREAFCAFLEEAGLEYIPSVGNFVLHRIPVPLEDYQQRMRDAHGILVGRAFPPFDRDWCRTSIGTDAEMQACREAMRAILAG